MAFIIGLLTLIMVLDSVVLILLVLIQLPKKEAGAGLAFGGATSDALFGAGSGNVLTKITKYAAGTFFVLAVVLSMLQSRYHSRTTSVFQSQLEQPAPAMPSTPAAPTTAAPTPSTPAANPAMPLSSTNLLSAPAAEATNLPAAPATPK